VERGAAGLERVFGRAGNHNEDKLLPYRSLVDNTLDRVLACKPPSIIVLYKFAIFTQKLGQPGLFLFEKLF